MCTGFEIAALAAAVGGAGMSAYGTHMNTRAAEENQRRQVEARNAQLRRTMARNDKIAEESRGVFDERMQKMQPEEVQQTQDEATKERTDTIEAQVDTPDAGSIPLRGSAPSVVKSDIAKQMLTAFDEGKQQAKALGTLGGYGDAWLEEGFDNQQAGRDIGIHQDAAAGNLGVLPYAQDSAEMAAYKPISPLGSILIGTGNAIGSVAGSMGGVPGKGAKPPASFSRIPGFGGLY